MPRQKLKHTTCTCKHHVSAHKYDPGLGGGPRKCVVPGCECSLFVSRHSARVARDEERFQAYLAAERARIKGIK